MLKLENFKEIIIANWKLNGSLAFTKEYTEKLRFNISNKQRCIIVCPPFTYINKLNFNNIFLGGQNCSSFEKGAYTGEISAEILKNVGCDVCIVGHSERRQFFNENNDSLSKKLDNCIKNDIIPVFCVGENLEEKNENITKEVLKQQLNCCISKNLGNKEIIIAYEPIWAIGTGLVPSLEEISEIHSFIKNDIFNDNEVKILYGGSVKANNSKDILKIDSVDGLLVGGASIDINEFNQIIGN